MKFGQHFVIDHMMELDDMMIPTHFVRSNCPGLAASCGRKYDQSWQNQFFDMLRNLFHCCPVEE